MKKIRETVTNVLMDSTRHYYEKRFKVKQLYYIQARIIQCKT